jgi:hypothetical protein
MDRLRIERVLWTIDLLIHDIRTRRRRTIRRDLRTNLRVAAAEHGVGAAIRQLGPLRQLARGYLEAQYGEGARRPRWMRGALWMFVCGLLIEALVFACFSSYVAGISAVNPGADGIYVWNQLGFLGAGTFRVRFVHGQLQSFTSLVNAGPGLLYLGAAYILGARLWRLLPLARG